MSSNEEPESASCSDDYTDISDTDSSADRITMSMQDILVEMVKKRKLLCEDEMVLTYYAEDVDSYYDKNKAVELFKDITDELRVFAIFLHFYSPVSYKYIQEHYNTPLPSIKVLQGWYENGNLQPGFTKQSFDLLARKRATKEARLICSLQADTMQLFIRNSYTPIDFGAGPYDGDDDSESREVFVILLVSLEERMKIPLGFFIGEHVSTETKVDLILMGLQHCDEIGVDVVAITQTYAALAERFGCKLQDFKNLKTTFKHPSCNKQVAVFIDPTLCLRSIRNKFEGSKTMYDGKHQKISWELIDKLKKMTTTEKFPFNSVPLKDILELHNIIGKIDLVSEQFTLSLAEALQLCKNVFKLHSFKEAGALIEFITIINTLFDIMHSKPGQSGFKQPICRENAHNIIEFLEEVKSYLSSISYHTTGDGRRRNLQLGVQDSTVSGFKGFLISIESLKYLYSTLIEKEPRLDSIATYQLAGDQMDNFFEAFHRRNPKQHGGKFQQIYQSFFKDTASGPIFIDRMPIQSYAINNLKKALHVIKRSSGKRSFDNLYSYVGPKRARTEDDVRAATNVHRLLKALHTERDQTCRRQMVGYVAGWIAAEMARSLKCERCDDALCSGERLWFHKFITLKELAGVCLSSEGVFRVCWECERAVRGGDVARRLLGRVSLLPRWSHRSHQVQLTRAVVAKYTRLRLGTDDPRQRRPQKRMLFLF